ncbi:MAG: HAMP domain-containing histidine kinase, partial [Candidatus Omnitrophica bacterium]|nr:HAMP domain-containing histidine kinase [Candidatus Omnitrophota bacterium]
FTALEEIRRTQEQLLHAARMAMIGEVSSGMAHEFRNILHAIKLHVEGCARPGMPPERIQKYMGVIFRTMTNAEQILNGILTFSRKSQSDLKAGSLKKTIEDTLLLLKRELQYQSIQLTVHLETPGLCDHDSGQISQVIMNLLNNARDALRNQDQKVVLIRLREAPGEAVLDLADNGPGIPKEVLKNLFQPFMTTKAEGQGTGLGLSVCRKIMENHGGRITVTTAAGEGTVWHLHFPRKV